MTEANETAKGGSAAPTRKEPPRVTGGRAAAIAFGAVDLLTAFLVYLGVFEGLPARYWLIDGAGALVMILFAAAGAGLVAGLPWARRAALATSIVSLVLGLLLVSTLALTASYLSGVYGPVGRGGSLILTLLAAMALPYLVVLPVAQLAWLRRSSGVFSTPPALAES